MIKFFEALRPPKLSSWQTFICVMLALFILAISAEQRLQNVLAIASFASGTVGATWAGLEKKWFFTPWFTVGLLGILGWQVLKLPVVLLCILWPPFSALFWLVTKSFDWENAQWQRPAPAVRQQFILIFMSQVLLSCWLQFSFVVQGWVRNYPSFLVDNFDQSVFVAPFTTESPFNEQAKPKPRGLTLLEALQPDIQDRLNQKDWSTLVTQFQESWVPQPIPENELSRLKDQVDFSSLPEDRFWSITQVATPKQSSDATYDYEVVWLAQWLGPKSAQAKALDPYTSKLRCTVLRRGQSSIAECADPKVVTAEEIEAEDEQRNLPWWRRLRLLPRGRSRDAG